MTNRWTFYTIMQKCKRNSFFLFSTWMVQIMKYLIEKIRMFPLCSNICWLFVHLTFISFANTHFSKGKVKYSTFLIYLKCSASFMGQPNTPQEGKLNEKIFKNYVLFIYIMEFSIVKIMGHKLLFLMSGYKWNAQMNLYIW